MDDIRREIRTLIDDIEELMMLDDLQRWPQPLEDASPSLLRARDGLREARRKAAETSDRHALDDLKRRLQMVKNQVQGEKLMDVADALRYAGARGPVRQEPAGESANVEEMNRTADAVQEELKSLRRLTEGAATTAGSRGSAGAV